jgi:amino acid adenylation domain-containing protein
MGDVRDLSALSPEEKRAMLAELLKKKAAAEDLTWPLSHGQRALWFVHGLDPTSSAYNISLAAGIQSALDVPALVRALQGIVRRHALLRATFPAEEGAPQLRIYGHCEIPFERIDTAGLSDADVRSRVTEHHRRPFDLATGLAYRIALFSRSAADHVFLFTLHHIVADGSSLAILLEEILRSYAAEVTGTATAAVLPPLRSQYRDFVDWQAQTLNQEGHRLERFWTSSLAGQLPVLELQTDFPRPPFQRFQGATIDFGIDPAVYGAIERFARSEGVTPFIVMLAAFYTVLARYSGQTDIIIGTSALGRSRTDFEPLVGYFVNPIALRASFDDDPPFRAFLNRVKGIVQSGLAHQDFPFPLLVERLHPVRDPARSPIFQTMFNMLRVAGPASAPSHGLTLSTFSVPQEEGQFDIALDIFDLRGQVTGILRYDTALFAASTAQQIARHYTALLDSVCTAPDLPLSVIPLLTDDEHRQIVEQWNATSLQYDPAESIEAMVAAQARRSPDAIAITGTGRTLSYRELDERSNQLASWLRGRGVGSGQLVGVCLQRTPDLVVALLGVLKSGAAYVPLDPAFPASRLAHMVTDSALKAVLTDDDSESALPETEALLVRLDSDWPAIAAQPVDAIAGARSGPEALAYVLYTSGSTGLPKGVQIPRRALTNFLRGMQQRPGISPNDVLIAVTTLSFDIAGLELFLPLTVGARILVATADEAHDGTALRELIESSGATIVQATPATWHMLIDAGWRGSLSLTALCGGEAMPPQLAAELLSRTRALWNMYGPTETTIWSTVARVERDSPISLGTPIANTQVYIIDKHKRPVPMGVAGELCIAGAGVALGYLNRPELTAERFVANPFVPGARMYRTGDLARFTKDGTIGYLGRSDFQVKVRGFRIELGEIESLLSRHPDILQAVATTYDDAAGRRLVAYVVYRAGAEPTGTELRRFVRAELPDYMVPSLFVQMESLPLTPNGKVDRRALPPPIQQGSHVERVAPRTDMERLIATVWSEALGGCEVSIHDNFFDIGGHSLLSVQVIAKLEKRVGVRLPQRYFTETLEQISAACEQLMAEALVAGSGDSAR